jgi:SAM-dependent methyltransferase
VSRSEKRAYRLMGFAEDVASVEALGRLEGSADLEEDIALCLQQTIEPVFRRVLPAGEKILEAGCGRGRWVFHLRRLGYDVVGIDIAESDVAVALRHDPGIPVVRGDVLHTGFPDAHFGAVISLGVVEHFETGPEAAFDEVRRILRPGGIFLVTVPVRNILRHLVVHRVKDAKRMVLGLRGRTFAFTEYRYSRRQFSDLLRTAGFEILEIHPDDLRPPRNAGIYADIGVLQRKGHLWELNKAGNLLNRALTALSPWIHCSGNLWVCRR